MKTDEQNRSLASELARLAAWAALLYLVGRFIGWTLERKWTAWIGMASALVVLVTFGVSLAVGLFLQGIGCYPIYVEHVGLVCALGVALTVIISIAAAATMWATPDNPPQQRRNVKPSRRRKHQ